MEEWNQAAFEAALMQAPQSITIGGISYTCYGQRGRVVAKRRYVATWRGDHQVYTLSLPPWTVSQADVGAFHGYQPPHMIQVEDIVRRVAMRDNGQVPLPERAKEAVRSHLGVGLTTPPDLTAGLTALLVQLDRTSAIEDMLRMLEAAGGDTDKTSPRLRSACTQALRKLAEEQQRTWSRPN